MKEIDHHDLVISLEEIINIYSDDMNPFAIDLVDRLVDNYFDYKQNSKENFNNYDTTAKASILQEREQIIHNSGNYNNCNEEEEDGGESGLAATGCLEAIQRILNSSLNKNVYMELVPKI